ncbi:reverse transcriptase domain-containing protein [Tanacetum coccineum]
MEKSIDQSDLESCESFECKALDDSDSGEPIWRIEFVNMSYPVAQKIAEPNKVKSEQLYSASANEIDEKKPELKNLPQHLEYAYLHGDKSFPIIISSKFSKKEKMLLLQVLEKRKGAIAWKMSDIKGINPSYYTHKILMEDDYKSIIQPQRRVNPNVHDVMKNEIVKLLDSGLIYPISYSSWVSPIHVVPNKGGMAVVLNDNNELIPSRTVIGWRVGHHSASITGRKVYESGFFWPSIFKDAKDYVMRCDTCQRSGNISSRTVDYVSKWVKAQALPTNDAHAVIKFLRRLFARFGVPKALISDQLLNVSWKAAAKNRFIELNELMELRDRAYENTKIYKERTKRWHDSRLRGDKNFKVGDKVLLFNSRFKMHPGKLKSRWYDPNMVNTVHPYGTVEIIDKNGISFKVNGQRLKKYHDGHIDAKDKEVVEFEEDTT